MENFSFIIPHKNTPDLLQKCLDSIPRREDVQIIVVDDNSDVDKVDFAHFPGLNDSTVEVYLTKEGRGAGYARNIGLEHAKGRWLVFADADDFFLPDLEKAMDEFVNSNYEMVFFKATSIILPSGIYGHRADGVNEDVDKAINEGDFRYLFSKSSPCCRFYKRNLIAEHNIRFREVRWSNDVVWGALCAVNVKHYVASPLTIYCITSSANTLTKNTTLSCHRVRFHEACLEMQITRALFVDFEFSNYWFYRAWYNVYHANVFIGFLTWFKAYWYGRIHFVRQFNKHFFLQMYNDSIWMKKVWHCLYYK